MSNKLIALFAFLAFILPLALSATIETINIDNKLGWVGMGTIQRIDSNALIGYMVFDKDNMSLVLPPLVPQLYNIGANFLQYRASYNNAVLSINGNDPMDCNATAKFHGTSSYVNLPNSNDKFVVFLGVVQVNPLNCPVDPFFFVVTGKGTLTEQ